MDVIKADPTLYYIVNVVLCLISKWNLFIGMYELIFRKNFIYSTKLVKFVTGERHLFG